MCGIAGFVTSDRGAQIAERESLLDRMCQVIRHRGPDEQGMIVCGRVALGMRRLSIIDLKTGQQPIYTEDRNLAIVFNGEIYNFQELKKELESLGHRFRTNSDTETIVHAYEEFGVGCLKKLRGMFAFAIWNFRDESLFIARDRVGKKPLFYQVAEGGDFVFGSELKTLLTYGKVSKQIDLSALDSYLTFGYVPEEFCIFKGVSKLEPGHFLMFRDGKVSTESYWDFEYPPSHDARTEPEYVQGLRDKIEDAVRVRLISEVPLGAFLSGGVDSSTVVAMMSKFSGTPVKTFSIGFNEDSFDELKYARIAAKHFGTEHHEFIFTPEMVELAEDLVNFFDEPFSDASSLPTFMVSKMARDFVTVILSGDGGDEVFAGYTRYATHRKRNALARLPKSIRSGIIRPVSEMLPHHAIGKNYLFNISHDTIDRYVDSVSQFNMLQRRSLYSSDFQTQLNGSFGSGEKLFRDIAESPDGCGITDRMLYLDSKTYLPGDILTKVDRMSMANSLEARAPFLDHELIEYAVNIPAELKLKSMTTKYVLKKAMEGIVPNEILYREKQGFGVPIEEWINKQLRSQIYETLLEKRTIERGYFKRSYIETLLSEHSRRRRDHSHSLWVLFMLELWHRRFLDV